MKSKQWLLAITIIGILVFAFFWGGNPQANSVRVDESTTNQKLSNTDSSLPVKEQATEEYNNRIDTEVNKSDVGPTVSGAEVSQKEISQKAPNQSTSKLNQDESMPKKTPSKTESKKDKYLTDPVPEGKPKPVEWQDTTINKNIQLTCTLSVTCKTILDNMDEFNKDKLEVLPEDGIIYKTQTVTFSEGESVFDVLLRELKKNKIHMEFEMTPIYNSNYIEGIHNLYEFDCGELSGWMYKVNGWFPNYGCSRYSLKDGDVVEWSYTCDLGRDIGGGMAVGGKGQ